MDDLQNYRRAAIQYLESLMRAGVTDLSPHHADVPPRNLAANDLAADSSPRADESVDDQATDSKECSAIPPEKETELMKTDASKTSSKASSKTDRLPTFDSVEQGSLAGYGDALPLDQRVEQLRVLSQQVASCTACSELVANRTQTVFGVGNPQPRLCFLGEGPGADEDRQGEPFVGRAGQLLNKIIEACQMAREDVYILNTVKCRPPDNRNPLDGELDNCWHFAEKQLEILQPEFIVCLGSIAARTLLRTKESVGRLREKFHPYRSSRVVVTYHPAYLLRNPAAKANTWKDMKMLLSAMGIELDPNRP